MTLSTDVGSRDFGPRITGQALLLEPESYSVDVRGGPKDTTIRVTGNEHGISTITEWLRCPVIIRAEGDSVWWGFVASVEITIGAWTIGSSLDTMINRVNIVYNPPILYGTPEQRETGWDQDDESVVAYGIKEAMITMADVPTSQALAEQVRILAERRYPLGTLDLVDDGGIQATLHCRGWLETLKWRHYTQPAGFIAHISGSKAQKLGLGLSGSGIGFSAERRTIHDLDGRLAAYKKDDQIVVGGAGAGANAGIKTVDQSTSKTPASATASTLSWGTETSRSKLTDSARGLAVFLTGQTVTISGSGAGNNGARVVKGSASDGSYIEFDEILTDEGPGVSLTLTRGGTVYTASTIIVTSGAHPKLYDSARGLGDFDAGDMVYVTGGVNTGWFRVDAGAGDGAWIEVDRSVTTAAAGAAITVQRGNSIVVVEALTNAYPGGTTTLDIYGEALRQRFLVSTGGWTVGALGVKGRAVGTPIDGLRIALYSDSAGNPGTLLDTITVAAADCPTANDWIMPDLSNTVSLTAATYYHVVVDRTGSNHHENYYEIVVDEDLGYADGAMRLKYGGVWNTSYSRSPDADMLFRVVGHKELTEQIRDIISSCGQFFAGVDIIDTSGIATPQYRDGKTSAYDELMALLDATTTGRRLIATVTPERYLRITEEPDPPTTTSPAPYALDRDGRLRNSLGRVIAATKPVWGVWVDVAVFGDLGIRGKIASVSSLFIEGMEIDPVSGKQRPRARGTESRFAVGGIRRG